MAEWTDIGDFAEVSVEEQEDVDRPELDAEGGDDSGVEEMIETMLVDAGVVVDEEQLR